MSRKRVSTAISSLRTWSPPPQFERLLALNQNGSLEYRGKEINDVLFVYCVGSREKDEERPYCSRYCCTASINAALSATQKFGVKSYHAYRDIRTYGKYESYYEDAGKNGAVFLNTHLKTHLK